MDIGMAQRLARVRGEHGYSQEALAAKLGVSRQAVSRWECADSSPDTDNLIALARLYGMSIDALLLGEGDGEPGAAGDDGLSEKPASPDARPAGSTADQADQCEGSPDPVAGCSPVEGAPTACGRGSRSGSAAQSGLADEGGEPEAPRQRLVNGLIGLAVVAVFVAVVLLVLLFGHGWAVLLVLFIVVVLVGMTLRSSLSSLKQELAAAWRKIADRL